MFVSTFGTGMAMGMPDVCKTPPFAIPAPFPDIGNNAMCIPGYFTILTAGMPDLNLLSMYAITQGRRGGHLRRRGLAGLHRPRPPGDGFAGGVRRRRAGVAPDRSDPAQPLQRPGLRRRPEPDHQAGAAVVVRNELGSCTFAAIAVRQTRRSLLSALQGADRSSSDSSRTTMASSAG